MSRTDRGPNHGNNRHRRESGNLEPIDPPATTNTDPADRVKTFEEQVRGAMEQLLLQDYVEGANQE